MYIKTKFFLLVCCVLAFISYRQSSAEISITLEATPIIACIGCSISFSVNSECNLENATFYWTFGDGSGDTTYVPYTSHAYTNPGIFNASVLVVKSGDSGSDDKTVFIFKLGSFVIDADPVYDILGEPDNFHIFAEKIQLKDSDNENWDSLHPRVKYQWYNCADGQYFESGYSYCYTFTSVFTFSWGPVVGVNGRVYCEQNPAHIKVSNSVSFYNTAKVY